MNSVQDYLIQYNKIPEVPAPVDLINHPPHYTKNGIECIDALEAMVSQWPAGTAYRLGNVLKYLWRHRDKGSALESLKKAEFYLKREIAKLEQEK